MATARNVFFDYAAGRGKEDEGDVSFGRRCNTASSRISFRIHWIIILIALIFLCQFAEPVDGRHHSDSHGKKHHRHCVKRSESARESHRGSGNGIKDLPDGRRLLPSDFEFVNLLNVVSPKVKAFLEPEKLAKILPQSFTFDGQPTFKTKTLHLLRELMKLNTDVHSEIKELLRQLEAYRDAPDITKDDLALFLRVFSVVKVPHSGLIRRYLKPQRLNKLLPGNFDVKKTANATVALHDIATLLNITLGAAKSKKLKEALEALISELKRRNLTVIPKEDRNRIKKTKWVIRHPLLTGIKIPVNKIRAKYKIIRKGNSTESENDSGRRAKSDILSGNNSIIPEKQIMKFSPVLLDNDITSSNVALSQQTKPNGYLLGNNSIIFEKRVTKPSPVSSSEKLPSERSSKKVCRCHRTHYKPKSRRVLLQPNINVEYDYSDKDASFIDMLKDNVTFSLIKEAMTGERTDTQTNTVKKDLGAKKQKST